MRTAIFFTPPPEHPLTRAAALWLGRDPFSGAEYAVTAADGFTSEELTALTAFPRRYGFHATLRAPFRPLPACGLDEIESAMAAMCADRSPVDLGLLRIERLGAFFALTPVVQSESVTALANDVVRRSDRVRAPLSEEELKRRRPERLTERQRKYLDRWGYPLVFDEFGFHMTLTGPVPDHCSEQMRGLLEKRFLPLLDEPITIDALTLFVEQAPPGDFMATTRVPFGDTGQRVDAA